MKAIGVNTGTSRLKDLKVLDVPEKPVDKSEVKVAVYSAGLNPQDYRMVEVPDAKKADLVERPNPLIISSEFSGIVTEVGSAVTKFKVGDAVYGRPPLPIFGCLAEYVFIDQKFIAKKPQQINHSQAAILPVTFQTAYMDLVTKAGVKPGQTVLVLGGAGGVGSLAVQIAKDIGARVIATGLTKDMDRIKDLDVDVAVDSQKGELAKISEKVDIIFDTVGVKAQAEAIHLVKDGGCVVSCMVVNTDPSITDNSTITFIPFEFAQANEEALEFANKMVEKGDLDPVYTNEISFNSNDVISEVKDALNAIWNNTKKGRTVVKIK
ncbi:NADP-dependent oxidoreductase [Secundilactobacillus folii]|uniref:Zinc-binding dehydrogenase n=1 Tax=Secundilactobacillus folii TaxID=2678357 RepID=A0A7X2XXG2_9LACO|nr:NADP-dependent oxidoreductase [Secundilactobacillus folii]MTV82723.1 zinc-binding dehydrogenase [Secundilactobacillus folii]